MSNVVERLKKRITEVKRMGFRVRTELLDGPAATWCILGGQKVIFLDLSHSADEQLLQLDEAVESYVAQTSQQASELPANQVA